MVEEDQVHQDKISWDRPAVSVWMDRDQDSTDLKEVAIVQTVPIEEEVVVAAAAAAVVVVVVVAAAEEEDRLPSRAGISCADFAVLKVAVNFFTQVTTVHQCLNEGSLLFKFFANRVQLNDTSSKEV